MKVCNRGIRVFVTRHDLITLHEAAVARWCNIASTEDNGGRDGGGGGGVSSQNRISFEMNRAALVGPFWTGFHMNNNTHKNFDSE